MNISGKAVIQYLKNPFISFSVLLAPVFLVFIFENGLYFEDSFEYVSIYLLMVLFIFCMWMLFKKIQIQHYQKIDAAALGWILLYLLTLFHSSNYEYTTLGLLRQILYVLLFFMVSVLLTNNKSHTILFGILVLSGVIVSVFGFANGFGTLQVYGTVLRGAENRIASVFQYPNTFAVYLATILVLVLGKTQQPINKFIERFWTLLTIYLLYLGIVYSYSRTTWLLLAGVLVAMFLFTSKTAKARFLLYTVIPGVMAFFSTVIVSEAIQDGNAVSGWGTILVAIVVAALLSKWDMIWKYEFAQSKRRTLWILLLTVMIFIVGLISLNFVSEDIINRIKEINLNHASVQQRIILYKDAWEAILQHPLFGQGANTWKATFLSFQSYPYNSRQSHSFLMDLLLDTGFVGLFTMFAILVLTAKDWVQRQINGLNTQIRFAGFFAVVLLLGHSAFDFDMSFGIIEFLLWILLAFLRNPLAIVLQENKVRTSRMNVDWKIWIPAGLSILVLAITIASLVSINLTKDIGKKITDQNKAIEQINQAISLSPYRAWYNLNAAKVNGLLYEKITDQERLKKITGNLESALEKAPNDAALHFEAALLYYRYGNTQKAIEVLKKATEKEKYSIKYAEQLILLTNSEGVKLYEKYPEKSKQFLKIAAETFQDIEKKKKEVKNLPPGLAPERPYEVSQIILVNIGEAYFYLKDFQAAERVLAQVLASGQDNELVGKGIVLEQILNLKQGKPIDKQRLIEATGKRKQLVDYFNKLAIIDLK